MGRSRTLALLAAMLVLCTGLGSARGDDVPEYELKAAFVYNFALFTEWPADWPPESSPVLSVCVYGSNPFGQSLSGLEGKAVRNKRISVRHEKSLEALRNCHIAFIVATETARIRDILNVLKGASVLTITDDDDGSQLTAIHLSLVQKRLNFEINMTAVERSRLTISSKLLRLARAVRRDEDG
jgi:hypothetical protein